MPDAWFLWIPVALALLAALFDLRSREIPDWISVCLVAAAVAATAAGISGLSWWGLALGLAVGLVVSFVFFALGGLGGGDVKLIAAIGACLGWLGLLQVLFWTALAGAALALLAAARGQRDFAYGPAILAGTFVYAVWPHGLIRLLLQ